MNKVHVIITIIETYAIRRGVGECHRRSTVAKITCFMNISVHGLVTAAATNQASVRLYHPATLHHRHGVPILMVVMGV
jgi:hypothetical protein